LQKEFENAMKQKDGGVANEEIDDIDLDLEMMEEDVFTSLQNQPVT